MHIYSYICVYIYIYTCIYTYYASIYLPIQSNLSVKMLETYLMRIYISIRVFYCTSIYLPIQSNLSVKMLETYLMRIYISIRVFYYTSIHLPIQSNLSVNMQCVAVCCSVLQCVAETYLMREGHCCGIQYRLWRSARRLHILIYAYT